MPDHINISAPRRTELRLGVLAPLAPAVEVLGTLPALRAAHPELALDVVFGDAPTLEAELIAGNLVCAVVEAPWPSTFVDFRPWPHGIGETNYVAVAAPALAYDAKGALIDVFSPTFTQQATFIDLAPNAPLTSHWLAHVTQGAIAGNVAAAPQPVAVPKPALIVPTEGSMLALAEAGAGIAVVAESTAKTAIAAGRLVALAPHPPARARHLACRRVNTRMLHESVVIEHLLDENIRP